MVYSRILISRDQVQAIVADIAARLNAAYADAGSCLALVALEGARYFAADLLNRLTFPIETAHIRASSYLGGTQSTGSVNLQADDTLPAKIAGQNVLIIDDIYDTGHTLSKLISWVNSCRAAEVKTCVLLEKQIAHDQPVTIDFLGTHVEDAFVIGYGLDYNNEYRDLPFIAELAQEHIS